MRCKLFLLVVTFLLVDTNQQCSNPQAEDGYQMTEGCLQKTCKTGVWRTSLATNMCCHDRKAYNINTTISSSMSEDGCARANLDCVEETSDTAKIILTIKNYCSEYATQDQVQEIKDLLVKKIDAGAGCKDQKEEEEKEAVLFLGYDKIVQLPSFTILPNCTVPQDGDMQKKVDTVAAVVDGHLTVCGGLESDTCSTLSKGRWNQNLNPKLLNIRAEAAASMTYKGLFVTGGFDSSIDGDSLSKTEYLTESGWEYGPRMRSEKARHCQLSVGSDVYTLGGFNLIGNTGYKTRDVYRLSEPWLSQEEPGEEWTFVNDMKKFRSGHVCALHDDHIYALGGDGSDVGTSAERMNLSSMTWEEISDLPQMFSYGQAFSFQSSLYLVYREDGLVVKLNKDNQWEEVTRLGPITDKTIFPAPVLSPEVLQC